MDIHKKGETQDRRTGPELRLSSVSSLFGRPKLCSFLLYVEDAQTRPPTSSSKLHYLAARSHFKAKLSMPQTCDACMPHTEEADEGAVLEMCKT